MMINRKLSSIYSQIWFYGPESLWDPVTANCNHVLLGVFRGFFFAFLSFIHSIKHLPVCVSVFGAGDTAGIWGTHPCPWVRVVIRWEGGYKLPLCHRPANWSQGEQQLAWDGKESRQRGQSPTQAERLTWFFWRDDNLTFSINTECH